MKKRKMVELAEVRVYFGLKPDESLLEAVIQLQRQVENSHVRLSKYITFSEDVRSMVQRHGTLHVPENGDLDDYKACLNGLLNDRKNIKEELAQFRNVVEFFKKLFRSSDEALLEMARKL